MLQTKLLIEKVIEFEIRGLRIEGIRVVDETTPSVIMDIADNGRLIRSDEEWKTLVQHWTELPDLLEGKRLVTGHGWTPDSGITRCIKFFRPDWFFKENWQVEPGLGFWGDKPIILRHAP